MNTIITILWFADVAAFCYAVWTSANSGNASESGLIVVFVWLQWIGITVAVAVTHAALWYFV